jgi:hypothetical protein
LQTRQNCHCERTKAVDKGNFDKQVGRMLLLMLAAQLAAPFPIDFDRWASSDDYPTDLVTGDHSSFQSVTQTLVDATGKIVGCRIETPSSSPQVDALACAIILKRGHFQPARWSDGTAVPGIYRKAIRIMLEGDTLDPFSDIDLDVDHLPDGKKSPAFVEVAFASESDGKIDECAAAAPVSKEQKPPNPSLVPIACQAVKTGWRPFTVLRPDGKPSRSVQNAVVKFTPAKRH